MSQSGTGSQSRAGSQSGTGSRSGTEPAWHQALAYALTGSRLEHLGRQSQPDLARLAALLTAEVRDSGQVGTVLHRVPEDLMSGIGPAQFVAALGLLRQGLGDPAIRLPCPQPAGRRPTPAEQRLLDDVPPHHGG